MVRIADLVQTMKDEPVFTSLIIAAILAHIGLLVYGFFKLYQSTSPSSSSSSTTKPSGLSSRGIKKFPGAEEELKKLIKEHKIE